MTAFLGQLLLLAQNTIDSVALIALEVIGSLAVLYDNLVNFDKVS